MEDTFLFSGIVFSTQKAPAHHVSVKDRGFSPIDFNSVWGDRTTFSFYQVSVPFQIFNHPRVLLRYSPALFRRTTLQPVSCQRLFARHNADIHRRAWYRDGSSYLYRSLHFYRKARDSSSTPKSHRANIPFRETPLFRKIQRKRIYKAVLSDSLSDRLLLQQGSNCKRKRQNRTLFRCIQQCRPTKHTYKIQEDSLWAANVTMIGLTIIWCTAWWAIKAEAAISVVALYLRSSVWGWWYSVSWTTSPKLQPDGRKSGKFMTENKILVQIIDHENGDSVLGQDYFASREKAEEFKRISDRAYGKLLGEGQTRIATEIIERWH